MDSRLKEQHELRLGEEMCWMHSGNLQVTRSGAGDRGWIMKTSGTRLRNWVFS